MSKSPKTPPTWVLVADAARARIFEWPTPTGDLTEISDLVNPDARLREGMLTSDRPGRTFASRGRSSGHPMQSPHSAQENAASTFAKEINTQLADAHRQCKYARLVLIAPPAFLGRLRSQLDDQVSRTVVETIDLNLTKETPDTIKSHLPVLSSLT